MTTTTKTRAIATAGIEAPPWFRFSPASDMGAITLANARQVSLRQRLRNHYWMHGCTALTPDDVDLHRRRMARVDQRDALEDAEVADLLTPEFGFQPDGDSWHVPELLEHWAHAKERSDRNKANGSKGGSTTAARRQPAAPDKPVRGAAPDEADF